MYSFFNSTMVILKTLINTTIIIVYDHRNVVLIDVYFSDKFSGCDCPNAILVKRIYKIKD